MARHAILIDRCLVRSNLRGRYGRSAVGAVYDRALLSARVAQLRAHLPPQLALHFSIKANPMPAVVQHMAGLVDDLLDLAHIESGRLRLETAAIPLPLLLEELVRMIRPQAIARGLRFEYVVLGEMPDWVKGDAKRLTQVLINLLGNAIKFTERGINDRHEGAPKMKCLLIKHISCLVTIRSVKLICGL